MDDGIQARLQEASRLFNNKNYAECESTLRGIANKDRKVRHNIAVAHYLAKGGDVREVVAELKKDDSATSAAGGGGGVALTYEGHEVAHYNSAVLLAYNGRSEEAAAILRDLLQLHECIAVAVLGRCVCLFQLVTNGTPIAPSIKPTSTASSAPTAVNKAKLSVSQPPRAKSDDDLIARILSTYMPDFQKDPVLFRMLQTSLAVDGSALHELYKAGVTPVEKAVYYNDLGVLAMGEGKYNVASLYFTKAQQRLSADASADVFTRHSILFNFAVCSIHRHDYGPAMAALTTAQESMQASPNLWLRIAQASLGCYATTWATADALDAYDAQQQERAVALCNGQTFSGFPLLQIPDGTALAAAASNGERRVAVLTAASRAAQNCIHILRGTSLQEAADACYADGRLQDFRTLQYAYIYAAAASLLLQDYTMVVKLTSDLLAMHRSRPILADVHTTALLYISESYCRMNKASTALKVLSGVALGELLVSADRSDGQQRQRTEALFVNLVLVHICNGNWKQAQNIMASLIQKIAVNTTTTVGRTAVILQIYLDLAQGNKEKVLELLGKAIPAIPAAVV